ncbi:MAG TPA: alpha/beta hydrolase [bacterium]|nr:alpha/beta hydrolase [bacterium]
MPGLRRAGVVAWVAVPVLLAACVQGGAERRVGPEEHALAAQGAYYVTTQGRPDALQPFLLLVPSQPKAVAVLFAGGQGQIGLLPDGHIRNGDNFLVRSRERFLAQGLAVAVIAPPTDHPSLDRFRSTEAHTADIAGVIAYLRGRLHVPVWLVGTSRGTISVAYAASRLAPPAGPDGIVLSSTVTVLSRGASADGADLAAIRVPTLLVQHRLDACRVTPFGGAEALLKRLVNAPAHELIAIEGGGPPRGPACQAFNYHGFIGREAATVRVMTDWIKVHPPVRS